jgi:hypothetical protein
MKERFLYHAYALESLHNTTGKLKNLLRVYHHNYLKRSVALMRLWGLKVDTNYFHTISKQQIEDLLGVCEGYVEKKVSLEECCGIIESIKWRDLKESRF